MTEEKQFALDFDADEYAALRGGFSWILANYHKVEAGLDPLLPTQSRAELERLAQMFPQVQPLGGVEATPRDLKAIGDIIFAPEGQAACFDVGGSEEVFQRMAGELYAQWMPSRTPGGRTPPAKH